MAKLIMMSIFLSHLLILVTNYVMWWGVFIMFTMIALAKMKFFLSPIYTQLIYYFVQEISGVFFMLSLSLNTQLLLVFLKAGFAPFHNWMNYIVLNVKGLVYIWLLTWQKLPYYIAVLNLLSWNFTLLVVLGGLLPLLQSVFILNLKTLFFMLMTSSGNNLIVYSYYNPNHIILVLPLYLYMMYMFTGVISMSGLLYIGVESVFILMSMPGSIPFYVKMLTMSMMSGSGSLLFVYFMIVLILNFTIGVNVMLNMNWKYSISNKHIVFMMLSLASLPYL